MEKLRFPDWHSSHFKKHHFYWTMATCWVALNVNLASYYGWTIPAPTNPVLMHFIQKASTNPKNVHHKTVSKPYQTQTLDVTQEIKCNAQKMSIVPDLDVQNYAFFCCSRTLLKKPFQKLKILPKPNKCWSVQLNVLQKLSLFYDKVCKIDLVPLSITFTILSIVLDFLM